jgi:hypothetical protein
MKCSTLCSIIFELIKGEMAYVRDLENIDLVRCPWHVLDLNIMTYSRHHRFTSRPCEKMILQSLVARG